MSEPSTTILLTGFGLFGGLQENPSWSAVKEVNKTWEEANTRLIIKEIPVTYDYIDNQIPVLLDDSKPDIVIHVGVNSHSKDVINLETCAHSYGYNKSDANKCHCNPSKHCHQECLYTSVNTGEIFAKCNGSYPPVAMSCNAGRFLCEYVYYTSMKHSHNAPVLFVHVPLLTYDVTLEVVTKVLLKIVNCCVEQLKTKK